MGSEEDSNNVIPPTTPPTALYVRHFISAQSNLHRNLIPRKMPFLAIDQHKAGDEPGTTLRDKRGVPAHSSKGSKRRRLFEVYRQSIIHDSPTLDEFYYHFASDEKSENDRCSRNKTQVVTKYFHPNGVEDVDSWSFLRVSQLWAWTIGDGRLSPKRWNPHFPTDPANPSMKNGSLHPRLAQRSRKIVLLLTKFLTICVIGLRMEVTTICLALPSN